jgi:hypothetical protein
MGDCTSRPTPSEIDSHISEYNHKNDRFFKIIPFSEDQSRLISSETSQRVLESRKYLFEKKYQEYIKKSDNLPESPPGIQEYLIEVQKAVGISQGTFCFNYKKPYVVVSLEPNGPSQSTFAGDYFRPKWYKLIQFKTLLNFAAVKFELRFEGDDEPIGSFLIKVKDIEDQAVHQGWFGIGKEESKSLMVRLQYVHNEKVLYRNLEKKCLDFIDEIDDVIRKASSIVI